jgi:iron complex transport system substrate-binding protein
VSPRSRRRGVALSLALSVLLAACSAPGGGPSSPPASSPAVPASVTSSLEPSPSPAAFPVTLADDEGTEVEIAAEPQRIVSLTPATTEILFKLGAGRRVAATTDFDDYPPEAVALPDVASFTSVDVEKIVGLEADLVIAGGNSFNDPAAIAQLRELGVPVLVTYAPDISTVLQDIELLGTAVGRAGEARDLTAAMQADFDQVEAATADLPRPRVFYELDATTDLYTAADDSFIAEMIELAGGVPITTGSKTDFAISLEKLVTADPEVIVLGDAVYGVTPEAVAERPGWDVMTAVKTGQIRGVNDLVVTRPGPRLVEGLRELALAIHPEANVPSPAPVVP